MSRASAGWRKAPRTAFACGQVVVEWFPWRSPRWLTIADFRLPICHSAIGNWQLAISDGHILYLFIRVHQLGADRQQRFERKIALLHRRHHAGDVLGLAGGEIRDGLTRVLLQLGDFVNAVFQYVGKARPRRRPRTSGGRW